MSAPQKIIYISSTRVPDVWAHSLQITKTCEALSEAGAEVELVVPDRSRTKTGDPYVAMNVVPNFKIRKLWTLDLPLRVPFAFTIMTFTFFLSLRRYLRRAPKDAVLYVRGELVIPLAHSFASRFPIVWETHRKSYRMGWYRRALPQLAGIVVITKYYRNELAQQYGISKEKILCAPDAVDMKKFGYLPPREEARKILGLPLASAIVLYSGSDLAKKGVQTLRDAALLLPPRYLAVFVGNIDPDNADARKYYAGFQPSRYVPLWLAAADILVLTGTGKSDTTVHYTSPMKLFEYLAAGKPIVASDLPSYREVLDEKTAYFVPPDNPQALAQTIQEVMSDKEGARQRSRAASQKAAMHTWQTRALQILTFLQTRNADLGRESQNTPS